MVDQGPKTARSRRTPALPKDAQVKIGEKLKALYDDVVSQPVPDRFKDLLARLDGGSPAMSTGQPETMPGRPEGVTE
ncbi:NepR family anti-sigma factor [Labrys wisconsinensis]|uniref:Anti-sigma factor NepR domain-containing protein n=1 Tax=Labrys wisconsinensis TaxID=425677 RepID=A0ABU0J1T1_9HYPH|nr:NepR family anti-sigma factor [Labrys wisconsinensis]MDQ0467192.1 hypothetical protein [Labrys wisconsinensis]